MRDMVGNIVNDMDNGNTDKSRSGKDAVRSRPTADNATRAGAPSNYDTSMGQHSSPHVSSHAHYREQQASSSGGHTSGKLREPARDEHIDDDKTDHTSQRSKLRFENAVASATQEPAKRKRLPDKALGSKFTGPATKKQRAATNANPRGESRSSVKELIKRF